jgi:hypothetical protein
MPRRTNIRMIPAIAAAVSLLCAAAHAQLDIPGPMHLARLRGVYVNAKGAPIQGADVTLTRDDMKGHSPVVREIIVGVEALTYLHSSTLYVIAGPGACTDDCSSVFTNRDKFNEAIRRNTGHND